MIAIEMMQIGPVFSINWKLKNNLRTTPELASSEMVELLMTLITFCNIVSKVCNSMFCTYFQFFFNCPWRHHSYIWIYIHHHFTERKVCIDVFPRSEKSNISKVVCIVDYQMLLKCHNSITFLTLIFSCPTSPVSDQKVIFRILL